MDTTSPTLLIKLKGVSLDSVAWQKAYDLYRPFIAFWLTRFGAPGHEVPQLVNDCMSKLFEIIQSFDRQRPGSFRTFLREVARNRVRDYRNDKRRHGSAGWTDERERALNELADPESELSRRTDADLKDFTLAKLLERARPDFDDETWSIFLRVTRQGERAVDVAKELGKTPSAVRDAKHRVLARLREEAAAMFEADEVDDIFA